MNLTKQKVDENWRPEIGKQFIINFYGKLEVEMIYKGYYIETNNYKFRAYELQPRIVFKFLKPKKCYIHEWNLGRTACSAMLYTPLNIGEMYDRIDETIKLRQGNNSNWRKVNIWDIPYLKGNQ